MGDKISTVRNLNPVSGIFNGSQFLCLSVNKYTLVIQGIPSGEIQFLPRVRVKVTADGFEFFRKQFPVVRSFAATLHKVQCETCSSIAVDLRDEVFVHGQLYVALSRTRVPLSVTVLLPEIDPPTCKNIVYRNYLRICTL